MPTLLKTPKGHPVRLRIVHLPAPAKVKRRPKAVYLFDVQREGQTFGLEIEAASREEAEALAEPGAVYVGELVETIPAKAARPTPQQANEQPRYPALRRGIAQQQRKATEAMATLRRRWLAVIERQPEKAAGAKNLNVEDMREIDAAIEAFMATMAGPRPRSGLNFAVQETAVVQETNILAHGIGVGRAAQQLGIEANPELTRLQRVALNQRAFERLSDGSRLRFEGALDTIRGRMAEMFTTGENPLAVAREINAGLGVVDQVWLPRIIRTEAAFASERAITETYRAQGVAMFEIAGDPGTDDLCVGFQDGGPYLLDNEEARPPYHPHCFCSQIPVTE